MSWVALGMVPCMRKMRIYGEESQKKNCYFHFWGAKASILLNSI